MVVALALVVGLVAVFSGTLSRSTDTEARADEARAEVQVRELELAAAQEERDFFETDDFVRWQARVHGFGRAAEVRFALPEDAPPPAPIRPIGPQDATEAMAPFEAWMELLFGA
jgi:type II secretory pathway pseudopilin PulG